MSTTTTPPAEMNNGLHWLSRYAHHGRVRLDAGLPEANALRSRFTPPAWRLLCRSDRSSFIPILRNRQLCFDSLVHYTQTLAEHGVQVAPSPELLDYFVQASYYFFDRMPSVPASQDQMTLLRLATRHGAVSRQELQRIDDWLDQGSGSITTRMTWRSVLRRANDWYQRQQLVVDHVRVNGNSAESPQTWHFACGTLAWRGYEIKPLVDDIDLWDEGKAMSSCLYKLRKLCNRNSGPSRFFSIKRNDRRCATLELVCEPPNKGMKGPDRLYGRWSLQDCRRSHNLLPSEELITTLHDFGQHYNNLSQRPGSAHAFAKVIEAGTRLPTPLMRTRPLGLLIR